jgi:hypothetical protein
MRKLIKYNFIVLFALSLNSCAGFAEMSETGEPPIKWTNTYRGSVKIVTRANLIRAPWNYAMGLVSAATNGGIDLRVDEPDAE